MMPKKKPRGLGAATTRNVHAASNSFTEDEINALDTLLSIIRRGGDPKIVARSPAITTLTRKFARMKATIERNKSIAEKTAATKPEQCTCEDAYAECFDANPTGHYVTCALWGTTHPNRNDRASGIDSEALRDLDARESDTEPHLS